MEPQLPSAVSTKEQSPRSPAFELIALGLVSFFTDISSEMIFAVLPIYFVSILGGSAFLLGVMEGCADLASSALDFASGYASDRTGKRKWIAFSGYGLSTIAKGLLLLLSSAGGVIAFRVIERLGKSIRGAPRDALLADIAPANRRGLFFGAHKAFDKAGAIIGPLIAYGVLSQSGESAATFRSLFTLALAPALLATLLLALFVKERSPETGARTAITKRNVKETLAAVDRRYWWYLAATLIFSLGYFSFAFLLLKAKLVGFRMQDQALLYGLINLVFTIASIPIGLLGDKIGRRALVIGSYLLYAAIATGFCFATSQMAVVLLFAAFGVFYAIDEGQAKAYITDLAPKEYRSTAMGIYGFTTGVAYLPASIIAGLLWGIAPSWTFAFGILTSLTGLLLFAATSNASSNNNKQSS